MHRFLFWCCLFSLAAGMLLAQIPVGQIFGVVLLRRMQPERMRPYKMWLYPLPCGLALIGWLYMYLTARLLYIGLGLGTLLAGLGAFLYWSWLTGGWPFGGETKEPSAPDCGHPA